MTNDQSDFTQGSILKETGNFYDAGAWGIDLTGCLWSGRSFGSGKIWFYFRTVLPFLPEARY